eukprot:TRINITY_DN9485_c0_g1_i1.p1 TRINITY_DN9485_c0_g1~~TRINITY_DN9485_c0_g1_i1.p1  ORF type:complete len:349 (+),score=47.96 TRINITY_DN9485_c0_g1_i1:41-1048(+)
MAQRLKPWELKKSQTSTNSITTPSASTNTNQTLDSQNINNSSFNSSTSRPTLSNEINSSTTRRFSSYNDVQQNNDFSYENQNYPNNSQPFTDQHQHFEPPQEPLLIRASRFVETFSYFSQLLGDNCGAIYGSYDSVMRFLFMCREVRNEFFFLAETYTMFRVIQSATKKILNLPKGDMDIHSFSSFNTNKNLRLNNQRNPKSKRLFWILTIVFAIAGSYILNKIWKIMKDSLKEYNEQKMNGFLDNSNNLIKAQALFDFEGRERSDLAFRKGDVLTVTRMENGGWWEAEMGERVGLIPSNYVQVLENGGIKESKGMYHQEMQNPLTLQFNRGFNQ